MEFILLIFGSVVIGAVVGTIVGIFGVGGGFLLIPSLMVILGVPGPIAVGTGLATVLVNSLMGLHKRKGSGTVDIKLALMISIGSVFGVVLGSFALQILKSAPKVMIGETEYDIVQYVLLGSYLLLLSSIAAFLYYDYKKHGGVAPAKRVGSLAKFKFKPLVHFYTLEEPELPLIPLLICGGVIGFLTGMLGIGGGVIVLPVLVYLVGQRTVKAAGTSLLLVFIASLIGVLTKLGTGDINLILLALLVIGGFIGTGIGTKIGLKLHGPKLRLYFVYVVCLAVVMIAVKLVVLLV